MQPIVALGRGLRAAGYDVTVAADPQFTPVITGAGLVADPFGADLVPKPLRQRWREGSSPGARQQLRQWREAVESLAPGVADHLAGLIHRHDTFLSGAITFSGVLPIARATGKDHVLASLIPSAATRSGPATMMAARPDADSVLNLAAGWAGLAGSYQLRRPVAREVCTRLGLPRQTFRDYVRATRRTPELLGVSPLVVPHPRDAPDRVVTTGYWVEPLDPEYSPPADLEAFLQAGRPPVYLGFGSMPSSDPDALVDLMVTALRRAGRRGLVHGNWDGWHPDHLPDDVLLIDPVPHEWLFPRTAAVVHHGGAGTTAAAARAGVPQLVVPHFGDQPYWGRRVSRLGIGPAPVPRRDLDADRLTTAITRLTGDENLRARAELVGTQIRAEDGVGTAVETIRRLLPA